MKRFVICLLSLILLIGCCGCKSGTDSTASNDDKPAVTANPASDFEYHVENDYIFIDKYIGTDKEVVIPTTIDGKQVEIIGPISFEYSDIISVTLPDTVRSIRERAFRGCGSLVEIKFGKGLNDIGTRAFYECKSLKSVDLPEGVTTLGFWCFSECHAIERISIPKTVTTWRARVFYANHSLTSIQIQDGLKVLGLESTFQGAISLESVTIPASVEEIGNETFSDCSALKSVYFLGDAPKVVGKYAFGPQNKALIIYYDGSTSGWDDTPLRLMYHLIET